MSGWPEWDNNPEADAERAALKARDEARDVELLAGMGLVRGQSVTWDGETWTVACAMGEAAVMLHNSTGFASDGAAIPVAALSR